MGGMALPPDVLGVSLAASPDASIASPRPDSAAQDRAARRSLREQIAHLERELADAFVTAYPMGGLEPPPGSPGSPRLLGLGELEAVRDELVERVRRARLTITRCAEEQEHKRLVLERMLLAPADYRFTRISCRELGEPGCGVWHVRPRLGLIGMLMGWWQVKLSSGCPLPRDHGRPQRQPVVGPAIGRA